MFVSWYFASMGSSMTYILPMFQVLTSTLAIYGFVSSTGSGAYCWDEMVVRSGVDVLDDRIFFRRVKARRPDDDAVDVGLAVAALGGESLGAAPAGFHERGVVRAFQLGDGLAVVRAAQLGDRWLVDARPGVDEEFPVGRELGWSGRRRPW